MKLDCIILAGGKATRFNFKEIGLSHREKSLIKIRNRPLIDFHIEAVLNCKYIDKQIIAVSPYTPLTKDYLTNFGKTITVFDTPGNGYHQDLKYTINELKLKQVMTINCDIPLIENSILDTLIEIYFREKKPAMSVMADLAKFKQLKLEPSYVIFDRKENEELVPLGLNFIDGDHITDEFIEEHILVYNDEKLMYNINTIEDYHRVISYLEQEETKL